MDEGTPRMDDGTAGRGRFDGVGGGVPIRDADAVLAGLDPQQREAELKKAQKDQDYFCNP